MDADERLRLIQAKVEPAKKHVNDLESEVHAFLATNPYKVGTKHDPDTRKPLHYLASVKDTPIEAATLTGDAIQNLRSALDHLVHHLVQVGTGRPGPFYHSEFPIFDSATGYKAGKGRKVQGASPEAVTAIDALNPYKGGNDTLWQLHKLNLVDKHRFLITVGSNFRSVDLGGFGFRRLLASLPPDSPMREGLAETLRTKPPQAFFSPGDRMFPLKAGDVLFEGLPDNEPDEHLQFRFEVAFGEPQVLEGEPLLETLHQMADLVGNVVSAFGPLLR
ncbi:MAG: hypothetical protein WBA31_04500 [Candidatus Dormiibacterota bacterium]